MSQYGKYSGAGGGGGGGGGTVTSVAIASPDSSITIVSGSPIVGAGTIQLKVANQAANSFAGYDGTGQLESVPNFNINGVGGQDITLIEQPNNGGGFTALNTSVAFAPLQNSPNENWNIYNIQAQFDTNNSGFSQGTAGNAAQLLNLGFTHNGTGGGAVGQLVFHNLTANIGNGTDPVSFKGLLGMGYGFNVAANATIDGSLTGQNFNPNVQAGALSTSNFYVNANTDSAQIGIPVNNYQSFAAYPNLAQVNNNFNYTGFTTNPNIAVLDGNASFLGMTVNPTLPSMGANSNYNGFAQNPIITSMGASSYLGGFLMFGVIGTSHGNIQGVSVQPQINGGDANFTGINVGPSGTATLPSVTGINVDMGNLASSAQKVAIQASGGKTTLYSPYHTDILPPSPGFLDLQAIGSEYWVKPGFSVSNTLVFAQNRGQTAIWEDDMGPDPFGGFLGYVADAAVIQGGVAITKTVDHITMQALGFNAADLSGQSITTGGTVNVFNASLNLGAIPGGGSLSIGELYGYRIGPTFGTFAANSWGFFNDTNSQNFVKTLAINTADTKVYSDSKLGIGDQTLLTGDIHASIRNVRTAADPNTYAVEAGIASYEASTFANDSTTAVIGLHNTTKVVVASGKTIGGQAGIFNVVSRAETGDDGTVPFATGVLTSLVSGNSATKSTSLFASYFAGLHSIDSNANQVGAMYDFYAQASSIGAGAVTNRYGLVIEADSGYTKRNFLSGYTLIGGSSYADPGKALKVAGDVEINNGHITSSQTTAPTILENANAGTGASSAISGTDVAGQASLTTGSAAWAAGAQVTVTFNVPYSSAPRVVLQALNASTAVAATNVFVTRTASDFTINFVNADVAATAYEWDYHVIETI